MTLSSEKEFEVLEASITSIHAAMRRGQLTARRLVEIYLQRIETIDRAGPAINAIITVNPTALDDADRLDAEFARTGVLLPLHGICVAVKDQIDAAGMPTTLGSVLFKDHMPKGNALVTEKIIEAGGIIIAKTALGEFGMGDTHGSLFGSTRNVFDLERTAGGSSGGSGAAVSANLCTIALGQEGFASIRRPASWNGIAGMRPTAGLIGRTGVFNGWPAIAGSLGPMARRVEDLAMLLDQIVGYDPEDPITAYAPAPISPSFTAALDSNSLRGTRLGVLRQPMGFGTRPESEDFAKVEAAFDRSLRELQSCGATLVDPLIIPDLETLLATRARAEDEDSEAFKQYFARTPAARFATREATMESDEFQALEQRIRDKWQPGNNQKHYEYLKARDLLMTRLLQVMAEHNLDAVVHKAVEHQPTLISEGLNPPFRNQTGAPHINTFLVFVPSVVVPAGFSSDDLPVGLTFLGRPYQDAKMLSLAFAYEQATGYRKVPPLTR